MAILNKLVICKIFVFMVVPIVATAPAATTQQADAEFFNKSRIVNEKIINDKILSQNKFKLPIDTVIDVGGWKLGLKLDSVGRVLKSFIGRDFSFGNKTQMAATYTWGPNDAAWLGSITDTASIKGKFKAMEEDGKLSLVFTADAWDSKIRTIMLRDGEQPEFIFNNGVKDTSDKGCVVEFSNVQKSGDDISLTVRLVGGTVTGDKIFYPPNFNLIGLVEASPDAQAQNLLDLAVHDTLTRRIAEVKNGNGDPYKYSTQTLKNVLEVKVVNNYKYPKDVHEFFARDDEMGYLPPKEEVSGTMYEMGLKMVNGKYVAPNSYIKYTSSVPLGPDTNAYLKVPIGVGLNSAQIALFGPPSSDVNVFGSLEYQNERARFFAVKRGANLWEVGAGAVVMMIQRPFDDTSASWTLNNGTLDSGKITKNGSYNLTREKKSTEFLIGYNLRVRVIDNRHIVIEDITPESMKGDKYYTPLTSMTPYERSQDTTDVMDPIAHSSVLKVYPNPAHDQLTVEVSGNGQTWVNLTDLYGRVVKNVYNGPVEGKDTFPIDAAEFPSGVYFLQVRGASRMEAIKVEIIH